LAAASPALEDSARIFKFYNFKFFAYRDSRLKFCPQAASFSAGTDTGTSLVVPSLAIFPPLFYPRLIPV
jgi:hypothetical protein